MTIHLWIQKQEDYSKRAISMAATWPACWTRGRWTCRCRLRAANALFAMLVDPRFNHGLPANLVPDAGVNCGFQGMQLSITSLTCAVRQIAGSSLIHTLPTEQYNQDVVSLGMHSAVTAAEALECVRNAVAMSLLAAAQAVDLRGDAARLGAGCRQLHRTLRALSPFLEYDRAMEHDISAVSDGIRTGRLDLGET